MPGFCCQYPRERGGRHARRLRNTWTTLSDNRTWTGETTDLSPAVRGLSRFRLCFAVENRDETDGFMVALARSIVESDVAPSAP